VRLETQVKQTIQKYRMLSRGDGVLAAVSGGPDSVVLLRLLWNLKEELNLRLEVAHLQHGIRGEEAREDARFVAEMAERLALPFHLKEMELPKIKSGRGKGNLEEMAREARRDYFAAVAGQRDIRKVALGHTRDDQAETFLMRLLRGSGRRGLSGMAPVTKLKEVEGSPVLIRPLIESSRNEIENYLAAEKLEHRVDRTNRDTALLRNWIRLELLPQLRDRIDRRLDERLARIADVMRGEEMFLQELTLELLPQIAEKEDLLRAPLLEQPVGMQRRLIRLWLEKALGTLRGVGFDHVEAILRLISDGPPQGRAAIPRGREAVRIYDALRIEKKTRARRAACYSHALPLGGKLVIPEAGLTMASARGVFKAGSRPHDDLEAVFDLRALPQTLTVRNFRNGDRFQPLGMQGHKKIKDLFIEKKVPLAVRATLPLLLAREEILWIPGYGRSEIAKVGAATKEVVKVKLSASAVSHQLRILLKADGY
jgi:tRNA(Ile)-lysidine synthase